MIIPRLLALGALAYAGLRLRKGMDGLKRGGASARRSGARESGTEPVRDVLVEDPVCGRLVPSKEALTLETAGVTRHFCGEACRLAWQLRAGRPEKTKRAQGVRTA